MLTPRTNELQAEFASLLTDIRIALMEPALEQAIHEAIAAGNMQPDYYFLGA